MICFCIIVKTAKFMFEFKNRDFFNTPSPFPPKYIHKNSDIHVHCRFNMSFLSLFISGHVGHKKT